MPYDTNGDLKFPLVSILRLYIFKLIKGFRTYEILENYLRKNEEEAFQLGVFKNENNVLEIPPKRTFNHYLQTKISGIQKKELERVAGEIILIANKKKILLDINIVKKTIKEKKKNYDREKREAIKLVKRLVYPNIDLKIKNNGKFTSKDLLDVLVHVALTHDFTNNGSFTFKEISHSKDNPSGDLMMYHFSKFKSVEKLREMFNKILEVILNFAKKNYNVLNQRRVDIAYDVHDIGFYGKSMNYLIGGEHKNGTSKFLKFLTCSIVVAGKRFILDIIPIHPLNSVDKLLNESLTKVKNKIRINRVYLDRGFDKSKIINVLKSHKVNFLMPKVRTPTVKAWFDKSEECKSRVIKDFKIGRGENKASANLVLVNDKLGIKRAFLCNFDIAPCLAYRLYGMYSKRWGIETAYRNIEQDFKARTTTTNYHIRFFYFVFSACVYNLWILVNICVSLLIYGRVNDKPLITAKMFVLMLYMVKLEYFEGDG